MTRSRLLLIAATGSALLVGGAHLFEYFGYLPCRMCYWQRYPHYAAVVIGLLALMLPGRVLPALGALAALSTAAIGLYHTGVERAWWEGPASCTGGATGLEGLAGDALLPGAGGAKLILCDQVSWELFGISMASWNMLFSLVLAGFWIASLRKS